MSEREIITATEQFVQSRLGDEGTGHDWWHAHRVRNTGLTIQAVEGGDPFVVEASLLVHDVGDRKVLNQTEDDHTIAADFLLAQGVGRKALDAIVYVISNMSYSKSLDGEQTDKSIELIIAQDADQLDAIGAIGIGRAFAFGGSRGRLLYDPTVEAQEFASSEAYKLHTGSTLHHFDEKLFKLKNRIITPTAQAIAAERDAYMHEFYTRFINEWNGQQ